jgi:hypothetical protein
MITDRTAAEIAGWIPPAECGAADHPITAEERAFAIEIAREQLPGLDEAVAAHHRTVAQWDSEQL